MKTFFLKSFGLAAVALVASQFAHGAGVFKDEDIDPRFRAKIMKEKAKQNQSQADNFNFNRGSNQQDSQCGSQNIGNVDTGGRIGAAPREVFVFAPNSINVVNGRGCR